MIKILILLTFITLSFQIDNCDWTEKICKGCISGYTLVNSRNNGGIRCLKTSEYNAQYYPGNEDEKCLYYSDSSHTYCRECKSGYILDYSSNLYECKEAPEHCVDLKNDRCSKCEPYFKLTKENTCQKSSCLEYENGVCICDDGYYLNEKNECSKIPIAGCAVGDATHCKECLDDYEKEGEQCKFVEEDGDNDREDITIPHCVSMEKGICNHCETNYDTNDDKTECIYLCQGEEVYCDECKDNYYSYDNGKTCEIIDPEFKTNGDIKLKPSEFVALTFLLLVIL
jgi:hypothetical protein